MEGGRGVGEGGCHRSDTVGRVQPYRSHQPTAAECNREGGGKGAKEGVESRGRVRVIFFVCVCVWNPCPSTPFQSQQCLFHLMIITVGLEEF